MTIQKRKDYLPNDFPEAAKLYRLGSCCPECSKEQALKSPVIPICPQPNMYMLQYSLRDHFKIKAMNNLPEAHVFNIKLFCFQLDKVPGTSEAWNSQAIKCTYFIQRKQFLNTTHRDKLVWTSFIIVIKVFPYDKECCWKDCFILREQR